MRTALRTRLARLERRHAAPHPTDDFKGIGISRLLASCPDPVPDRRDMATQDELRWMWGNRETLDRHCPYRESRSLADLLAYGRERLATARRLMAETETV